MIALLLTLTAPARAGLLQIEGFVSPQLTATVRPKAVPADQLTGGLQNSAAGVIFSGEPDERWAFKTYLLFAPSDVFPALTGVSALDRNNDGNVDGLETTSADALGSVLREVSVTWRPTGRFDFKLGRMPLPFTSQAQSPDTALLFPQRSGPNRAFLADDDLGGLLSFNLDGVAIARLGLFNGTGVGPGAADELGAMYLGRLDINPLGSFDFAETAGTNAPLRIGLGAGLAYHPYTSYDSAGYPDVRVSDFRGSASIRVAAAGVSVSAELLRRYQVDDLTDRPVEATGAYGQAGWLLDFGLEPIFRMGWTAEDQSFDPRYTIWTDAGFNFYPGFDGPNPDGVRITAQYLSENRVTEQEAARGLSAQVQVKW